MNTFSEELPVNDPKLEKQAKWDKATEKVEAITDKLGKGIDEGIKETVVAFHVFDIPTDMSCEGHIDWGVASPWIDVSPLSREQREVFIEKSREIDAVIEAEEAIDTHSPKLDGLYEESRRVGSERDKAVLLTVKHLSDLLTEFYFERAVDFDSRITLKIGPWSTRLQCEGAELQKIAEPEAKAENLRRYQSEFKAFTEFLKEKYFKV